jgi:hypothetical protein
MATEKQNCYQKLGNGYHTERMQKGVNLKVLNQQRKSVKSATKKC